MSRPGSVEYDHSPLRSACPRCGTMEEEACEPIRPHGHATILGYHPERGVSPGHLERDGYLPYVLVDETGDFKLHLMRKPTQRPVERDGWRPEGTPVMSDVDSETIRRQDRAGMMPGNEPRMFDGELLVPCPEHPESSAVDCIVCEPVDPDGGR